MATKLHKLLEEIDPSKTIDVVEKKIFSEMATFHREKNTVDSREEFEDCIAEMYGRINLVYNKEVYNKKRDKEYFLLFAYPALAKEMGDSDLAYKIMKTGVEGGVFSILQIIARYTINRVSRKLIGDLVKEYWDDLMENGDWKSAAKEYVELTKDIIPLKDVNKVVWYLSRLLDEHPFTLKKIRELNG